MVWGRVLLPQRSLYNPVYAQLLTIAPHSEHDNHERSTVDTITKVDDTWNDRMYKNDIAQ